MHHITKIRYFLKISLSKPIYVVYIKYQVIIFLKDFSAIEELVADVTKVFAVLQGNVFPVRINGLT